MKFSEFRDEVRRLRDVRDRARATYDLKRGFNDSREGAALDEANTRLEMFVLQHLDAVTEGE